MSISQAEFRILSDRASECQKKLNQWRHDYALHIIAMSVNESVVTILLERQRKEKE